MVIACAENEQNSTLDNERNLEGQEESFSSSKKLISNWSIVDDIYIAIVKMSCPSDVIVTKFNQF